MSVKVSNSYYRLNNSKKEVIRENYGLIVQIASKFATLDNRAELDDIIQLCSIGFIKALKHYDPSKGILSSYAKRWMWNEYNRYIQKIPENLYLEDIKVEQSGDILQYEDLLTNNKHIEEEIVNSLHLKSIQEKLPEKNISIIKDYLLGKKQSNIAREQGVSRQRIGQIVTKFKNEYGYLLSRENIM